jgi:cobalt-zinc-cadmium efflux system outer membrane protein
MTLRSATHGAVVLGLLALLGCYYPVREKIDADLCNIAKQPFDIQKLEAADQQPFMPPAEDQAIQQTAHDCDVEVEEDEEVICAAAQNGDKKGEKPEPFKELKDGTTLQVPPDLLLGGAPAPLLSGKEDAKQRRERLRREFQPLRPPGPDYEGVPGPFGHPLTLAELQKIGLASSPLIKQAVAQVESARGNAFQAGLPPNPTLGFEDDTFGTTGGAGYPGGFLDQLIITGGKLRLQRAVAAMDLRNAEVALRRAQMDLATRIRTYYFQLLVARENMRINRILVAFADSVYEVQARSMRGVELPYAVYEPMYLRALASMARTNLITARNSYLATWKQLASTLGKPGMPLTQVDGRVDMPVPVFDFNKVWLRIGQVHTDVVTADNTLQQARFALALAQAQLSPNVDVRILIQKDYTGPPNAIAPSLAAFIPLMLWNRNQGGIAAAQADVIHAAEEPRRVRNDLYQRLADAFGRYQSYRKNLALYRDTILPDLVRVYNGIYRRYRLEVAPVPPAGAIVPALPMTTPTINDVVVAQQFLMTSVGTYITNLAGMWQAVVDVTDLIQTSDMFRMGQERLPTEPVPVLPDLEQLKPLLPTHPCSPLQDPKLLGGDGSWPEAIPTKNNYFMPPADSQTRKTAPSQPAVVQAPAKQPIPAPAVPAAPPHPAIPPPVDPRLLEPPPDVPSRLRQ